MERAPLISKGECCKVDLPRWGMPLGRLWVDRLDLFLERALPIFMMMIGDICNGLNGLLELLIVACIL